MDSPARHCPFLNRSDPRCSASLTIERLRFAFEFCCNEYQACDVYRELLIERRLRHPAAPSPAGTEHASPIVHVTVARRNGKPIDAGDGFPSVPGLRTGTGG